MDDEYTPDRGKLNGDDQNGAASPSTEPAHAEPVDSPEIAQGKQTSTKPRIGPSGGADNPQPSMTMAFEFNGRVVRTVGGDSKTWFVTADVCAELEHGNPTKAVLRLDDDEKGLITIQGAGGGRQDVNVVSESGLYHLVLTSRKPQAKVFRRWVTDEVLPSIRRTGRYEGGGVSGYQGDPTAHEGRKEASAGIEITLPRGLGRYIIMVIPGEPPHVRRTEIDAILSEGAALDVDLMASCLKTIGAFWHKVEHMRALGLDPAASFPSDRLQKAILEGLEIARHYARLYDRETAEEAERIRAACHDASPSNKKG